MSTALVIALFVLANGYLAMGFYAYARSPHSRSNRVYLAVTVLFAAWSLAALVRNAYTSPTTILTWRFVSALVWSLGTALIVHFAITLVRSTRVGWGRLAAVYGPAIGLLVGHTLVVIVPFVRGGIASAAPGPVARIVFGGAGIALLYLAYVAIAVVVLERRARRAPDRQQRVQSRIVTVGLLVSALLTLTIATIIPELTAIELPFITPFAAIAWTVSMHIAVTRFRLLQVSASMAANQVMDSVLDVVIIAAPDGTIVQTNDRAAQLLGIDQTDVRGRPVTDVVAALPDEGHDRTETTLRSSDGGTIPVRVRRTVVPDEHGTPIGIVVAAQDLRLEHEFRALARTDALTDLANRLHIDAVLADELRRAHRSGHPCSLIIFDIDDFKRVNDTFGHQVGDRVLVGLARRAAGRLRATDTLGRWGGEEFLAILPETTRERAATIAEELRERVAAPPDRDPLGEHVPAVTCSFGVATFDPVRGAGEPGIDAARAAADVVRRADAALYDAKKAGKNCVRVAGQVSA